MCTYNPSTWEAEVFCKLNVFRSREHSFHKRSCFKRKRGGERQKEGGKKEGREGDERKEEIAENCVVATMILLPILTQSSSGKQPRALERDKQNSKSKLSNYFSVIALN